MSAKIYAFANQKGGVAKTTSTVNLGAAHGALAMTTPGDTSMASKAEVLKLARGTPDATAAPRANGPATAPSAPPATAP